jgi:hypothetical protein
MGLWKGSSNDTSVDQHLMWRYLNVSRLANLNKEKLGLARQPTTLISCERLPQPVCLVVLVFSVQDILPSVSHHNHCENKKKVQNCGGKIHTFFLHELLKVKCSYFFFLSLTISILLSCPLL